jgi:hypothetical protein
LPIKKNVADAMRAAIYARKKQLPLKPIDSYSSMETTTSQLYAEGKKAGTSI